MLLWIGIGDPEPVDHTTVKYLSAIDMLYTEASLVQKTTAEYLEKELGWDSVYAYNETFDADGMLGRDSDRGVVLVRTLREKLIELNPDLPADTYDDAVRQVMATVASQALLATNREKYGLIKDGVQVTFRDEGGELVGGVKISV